MKAVPVTPGTLEVARRIVWFEEPEEALADPVRFLAYAMTYARHADMQVIRQYVSDEDFLQALDRAPPGIIDPRSWAYWNLKMGRFPPPPLPARTFDDHGTVAMHLRMSAEDRGHAAAREWQKIREPGAAVDCEEKRRRALRDWHEKYGPGKQQ